MHTYTWDDFETVVMKTGAPTVFTEHDCNRAALEIGLKRAPLSYIECMSRFGLGVWSFDLFIGVPFRSIHASTLRYKAESYTDATREFLTPPKKLGDDPLMIKISNEWRSNFDCETLERLICFGTFGYAGILLENMRMAKWMCA